jgi:hypothetical protein
MAGALQASDDIGPVGTLLDGPEQVQGIHFSATWHPNDLYVCRVVQSHGTCQVRGGVPSIITAKSDDVGFELVAHVPSLKRNA